jgi:hypothetical protein
MNPSRNSITDSDEATGKVLNKYSTKTPVVAQPMTFVVTAVREIVAS